MKNYIQPGDMLTIPAPAAVSSGDGVLADVLFGVAGADAESGAYVAIATTGVFSLPKLNAQEWTVGAPIYWDPTPGQCTTVVAATNVFIGVAAAAAINPSTTGVVRLNGAMPAAAET